MGTLQVGCQLSQGIPKHIADTIKAWDDKQLVQELEICLGQVSSYT